MTIKRALLASDEQLLCLTECGPVSRDQLRQQVAAMQATLASSGQRVLLYHPCSYHFLVQLLALLGLGKTIVLPANDAPQTLTQLTHSVDLVLHRQPLPKVQSPRPPQWQTGASLQIYTSGSSGEAKAVEKQLGQIEREICALESLFGQQLGTSLVVATVSHQHIYGLLFRLLWPFCAGRPFWATTLAYPEQIAAIQQHYGAISLIASPALLSRLDHEITLAPQVTFSSGGPLPSHCAMQLVKRWRNGAIEVFGSTETGGIAWRQVSTEQPSPLWQPLPGVIIASQQQRLQIQSPFLADNNRYLTDDLVELSGQHFELQGRADRVIKLAEKRLSLAQMEAHLLAHPEVEQAVLVPLAHVRPQLGAILVLTTTGQQRRTQLGNHRYAQSLKQHLLQYFDRTTLPRRWRYLNALPYTAQGKLPQQQLREIFDV
ncbi:AMP-binding protein [Ferrimonas senticii]|uniref:AMP-binding protein n=1 Tax=Ferrimonas senticii TaxID=394566 RepID=UPI000419B79A|nr:AMP-binding protein [Ferrimonas senticii]